MKPASFLIQLLLFGLALVGINLAVTRAARNSPARVLLRQIDQASPSTDLFLGNSLMAAGFDPAAFHRLKPDQRALNLSLGATEPAEHYLILKTAQKQRGSALYYGFFDRQLTDSAHAEWSDIVGNRAIGYITDLESVLPFYVPDEPLKAWQLRVSSHVPLIVDRAQICGKAELLRRKAAGFGLPAKTSNQFGQAADFTLLEADDTRAFARACRDAAANQMPFNPPIRQILALSKQRNIPMIFVEMPMPSRHRQRYYDTAEWKLYRRHLQQMLSQQGCKLVDASDWVSDGAFEDALHLSSEGAALFTQRLLTADNL